MLCLLMLSVAVHGVTKIILKLIIFLFNPVQIIVIPNNIKECGQVKIISENLIDVVHFAQSIVLGYHSILKINWGSFQ